MRDEQLVGPSARQQRAHGQEGDALGRQGAGELDDDVVERPAPPEVDGTVRGGLARGVDRRLREVRDDHLVALGWKPRIDVVHRGGDAVGDPVAESVVEHAGDGRVLRVDGVDVRRAVQGELDGLKPGAAADVQAPTLRADMALEQVLAEQERAIDIRRRGGVVLDDRKRERRERPPRGIGEADAGRPRQKRR